jgi:uncharacterized membrane protein
MAVNRFRLAWDTFVNPNKFNEALYKLVGAQTTTYNATLETLMTKGYGENPDVNAIINQMASKSTAVPYIVKPIEDEKAYKKIKRFPNNPTYLQQKKLELLIKEAYKDVEQPMPIEKPNPNQTWEEFIYLYKIYLKVCGNVYFYRLTSLMGEPLAIYILPSHWVQIVLKANASSLNIENPIDYYILQQGNQLIKFEQNTIIHIKRSNPFYNQNGSHLYGYSELMAAIRNINSSNSFIDTSVKTSQNAGVYGFIHAGDGQSPLTQEQANDLKQRLVDMNDSKEMLSNIAGASGKLGFTRISLTTDELKPFDYLSNDRRTLCNCLNYPIDLLNEERSGTGFGVDAVIEARKRVVTDNIKPDLDLLASYLNKEFIQMFKGYEKSVIEFDISELPEMQTDTSEMINWMVKAPLTPNEIREAINYEAIEDENLDVVYINSNLKRIDDPSFDEMNE